jgi:O-antigen/teichoic acid export membrane protein
MDRRVVRGSGRRLLYAGGVQAVARAVQLAGLAAGSAMIARHDSAQVLGSFGLAVLILNLIQTSGDWGLTAIGTQALVNSEPAVSPGLLVRVRAQIQSVILAVGGVAVVAAWATGNESVATGAGAGVIAGIVTNLAASMTAPFQSLLRLDVPAWIDIGCRVAGLGALAAAVYTGQADWMIVGTLPAAAVIDLVLTAVAARRFGFPLWASASRDTTRSLMRRATPLAVLTIFGVLYMRANSVVVLALLGSAGLGAYSLAFRVVDVLVMVPSLVLAVSFPVLVRLHATDAVAYRTACQRAHDTLIGVGCALSLATVLAAHPLIQLLGGTTYLGVVTPLRILAIAGLAGFSNALFAQLMIIEGLQSTVLRVSAVALALNLALSVLLVHTNRLTGAAIAAVISEVAGAVVVIGIVTSRAALGVTWRTTTLVITAAGALTGLGLLAEHLGVSATATTVGALMLFVTGLLASPHHPVRSLVVSGAREV